MTDIRKILTQASKGGCEEATNLLDDARVRPDILSLEYIDMDKFMFRHDFALAYFGDLLVTNGLIGPKVEMPIWQWHLRELVLENPKDRIAYLLKYLKEKK